jgi:hypothetical protein
MRAREIRNLLSGDMARIHHALAAESGRANPLRRVLAALRRWSEPAGAQVIKLPYCPPLAALWSWRRASASPSAAEIVHCAFLHEAWRERGWLARLGVALRLALLWLPTNAAIAAWSSALNARAVKRRTGKGIARQLAEQLPLLARHDIRAINYYAFELYDDARRARAADYLQRSETKGGAYLVFKRFLPARSKLANKLRFFERCEAHGIRTIPVLAVAEKGALRLLSGDALPHVDLFVKPKDGRGGVGADWWAYEGAGRYRSSGGTPIAERELPAYLTALARDEAYIVGPRLLSHPALADLGNGALSTARVVTILDERGVPEATDAVFRMAIGANRVVDNFHAGGLAANVGLASGVLGRATDLGLRPDIGWRDTHPNGAQIAGRVLPFWPEALELAKRAHAAFADRVAIGWDVAFLADGPCLVEGNGGPDLDIHQRCALTPAGATRLGELLAFHTQRALAACAQQHSRG